MAIEREVVSLSLSPKNPDAQIVLDALRAADVPKRQQSALLLRWLAGYLRGERGAMAQADDDDDGLGDLLSKLDDL